MLALLPLTGVEEPYSGDTHFWFHSTQGYLLSGGLRRLAPLYDLVTTSVYLPKDSMALTLNGTTKWPNAKELQRLGETRMGATPARVRQLFERTATAIADTSKEVRGDMKVHGEFMEIGNRMLQQWEEGVALSLNRA